jgi:hypothetical protein
MAIVSWLLNVKDIRIEEKVVINVQEEGRDKTLVQIAQEIKMSWLV